MTAPNLAEGEVTRRRSAAYFFAVGVNHEQHRHYRETYTEEEHVNPPVDISEDFAEWYRQKAVEMYITQTSYHLQSVPDAWDTFLKERALCAT